METNENNANNGEVIDAAAVNDNQEQVNDIPSGDSQAHNEISAFDNSQAVNTQKTNNKKLLIIATAVIVAVIGSVAVFAFTKGNSLDKALEKAAADYYEYNNNSFQNALKTGAGIVGLPQKAESDFSIKINNITSKSGIPLFLLNGSKIAGAINIDKDVKRLNAELGLLLRDTNVLDFNVNVDNKDISLQVPQLYEKYFSFNADSYYEDLENSPFMALTGSTLTSRVPFSTDIIFSPAQDKTNSESGLFKSASLYKLLQEYTVEQEIEVDADKGEKIQIGEFTCTPYTVSYGNSFFSNFLQNAADTAPGTFIEYINELAKVYGFNQTDLIMQSLEHAELTEPIKATYYIDKGGNLRKAAYTAALLIAGDATDINIEAEYFGKDNIYDDISVIAEISTATVELTADVVSAGIHGSQSSYSDESEYKFVLSIVNSDEAFGITVNTNTAYNANDNKMSYELKLGGKDLPGGFVFGVNGEIKPNYVDFNDIYVESPIADLSISVNYALRQSETAPKGLGDITYVELLKLDDNELIAIENDIYNNAQSLAESVMGLFGF